MAGHGHAPRPAGGQITPIDAALRAERGARPLTAEWTRLGRLFPAIHRSEPARRGPGRAEPGRGVGVHDRRRSDARAPPGSTSASRRCRGARRRRRCGCSPRRRRTRSSAPTSSATSPWSVLFDDVELTAAEVARLAKQARPLVQSPRPAGSRSTASTSSRRRPRSPSARRSRSSPAPRSCATASASTASGLRGGVDVRGQQLGQRHPPRAPATASIDAGHPAGGIRRRAAHVPGRGAGWIGFLDAAELGGCLALDMGLGKTPTVLAHLARTARRRGPALVIAPAAVVGNWAAEAARFAPGLRVVVHHGASRSSADELAAEIAGADVVITTYATAVRDIDALAAVTWGTARARRGAGDQEPGERDRAAAAPHPGPHPARAHRHADRERPRRPVGDPRLHQPGPRRHPARVHRPDVGRRRGRAAGAERHPAVPPHEDASRRSPPSCPTRSTSSTTAR